MYLIVFSNIYLLAYYVIVMCNFRCFINIYFNKVYLFIFSMENVYLLSAFKTISFICDVITYPVYLILQQPWNKKHKSRQLKVR